MTGQIEGTVTQDESGIGFTGSTFAHFERGWKPQFHPYWWKDCVFLEGFHLQPRLDGKPVLLTLEAYDLLTG